MSKVHRISALQAQLNQTKREKALTRELTADDKRDQIIQLIAANPNKCDVVINILTGANQKASIVQYPDGCRINLNSVNNDVVERIYQLLI